MELAMVGLNFTFSDWKHSQSARFHSRPPTKTTDFENIFKVYRRLAYYVRPVSMI